MKNRSNLSYHCNLCRGLISVLSSAIFGERVQHGLQLFRRFLNLHLIHLQNADSCSALELLRNADRLEHSRHYHIYDSQNPQWNSYLDHNRKLTWAHQNDWSAFFKDDWKVHPSFTLNLRVRYEFYGAPYEHRGLTPTPVGGGLAMLGVSGRSFDQWLRPDFDEHGNPFPRPNTLLIASEGLEAGEALDENFSWNGCRRD